MNQHDMLTLEDFQTRTWKRLVARMEADRQEARDKLESQMIDDKPIYSTRLRTRIALLSEYIALADKAKADEQARRSNTDSPPHPEY